MLLGGLCPWGSRPLSWPENSCLGPFSGPGPTPRDPGWPVSSSGLGLWEGVLCTCPQRDSQWGFRKHCEQPGVGSPAHRVQMGPASLLAVQAAPGASASSGEPSAGTLRPGDQRGLAEGWSGHCFLLQPIAALCRLQGQHLLRPLPVGCLFSFLQAQL